jgi:fibrillarin-like pre-rRNA processing protein
MQQSRVFEVYEDRRGRYTQLYTRSLAPGTTVYGEGVVRAPDGEYREWDPTRSKLAAAILKGCPNIFIRKSHTVLYLGAASGTTVSHVSDIVGPDGFVFALDFAPRVVRDLVFVCETRKNIAPMLEDAFHPENYKDMVPEVDIVYQDIAQRNQVEIFKKNCDMFLKKGGYGLLCIKSRSIDVSQRPTDVFKKVRAELEKWTTIVDSRDLSPFQKDHMIFLCKK